MQTIVYPEVTIHRAGTRRAEPVRRSVRRARRRGDAVRRLAVLTLCLAALLAAFRLYGRVRARFGVQLSVETVLQNPELPNGCEATSLAAVLQTKGIPADKLDLAYGYIPRSDIVEEADGRFGPDPEQAYAGDPATGLGFYCFAEPIVQGANAYLQACGSSLRAVDITGVTGDGLLQYLRGGDPVIVWITTDLQAPRTGSYTWTLWQTGETYTPYVNLHCVVLTGWSGDICSLMDPLRGETTVDADVFLDCFVQMGSRAVVVH